MPLVGPPPVGSAPPAVVSIVRFRWLRSMAPLSSTRLPTVEIVVVEPAAPPVSVIGFETTFDPSRGPALRLSPPVVE